MNEAADLRAARARCRVRIYELAPQVGMHPATLGAMLNERRPIPPAIAARLRALLAPDAEEGRRGESSMKAGARG